MSCRSLDLPRDTLVRLVEAEPFDFEPGTAQIYNNSAFFLLGLIIESLSGQSYEDFVEERLFDPAGMVDSYYCHEALMRDRRAHGYDAVGPRAADPGPLHRSCVAICGRLTMLDGG